MDKATRSRLMSRIRGTDTEPELLIRKGLFALGYRYQLHRKDLPGKPDLTFPKYRAVIFVHGCFWHGHDCHLFRLPGTRTAFWKEKIESNRIRDQRNVEQLQNAGWKVLEIWECALRGRYQRSLDTVISQCSSWLETGKGHYQITGKSAA